MTDNTNTERDAFEAWMHQEDQAEPEPERTYEFDEDGMNQLTTDCMWVAWQARASLAAKPERAHLGETYFTASDMATAPMPNLTALTAAGEKAWAGVDAQDLRDGMAEHGAAPGGATEGIAGAWFTAADMATAAAQGFRDGKATQAAVAAWCDPAAEVALRKVLAAVQRYLPPDGPSAKDTLSEIIGVVDPWPMPSAPQPAVAAGWVSEWENLRKALQFYANREHFTISNDTAWDTVSGEPQNYWCDEAGTATVEDGYFAKLALQGHPIRFEDDDDALTAPSTEGESNGGAA